MTLGPADWNVGVARRRTLVPVNMSTSHADAAPWMPPRPLIMSAGQYTEGTAVFSPGCTVIS